MSYQRYGDGRELKWYHWLPLRDRVDAKTSQINNDYLLAFGGGPAQLAKEPVDTGYCDFELRRCWVNCEAANVTEPLPGQAQYTATDKEQFITSVYIAAHERAHARWTDFEMEDFEVGNTGGLSPDIAKQEKKGKSTKSGKNEPKRYDKLLHTVWNVLEDERIERLLERDFTYLNGYLKRGSKNMLRRVPNADMISQAPIPDDPNLILAWILRRRVLNRSGVVEECPLNDASKELLAQAEPILDKAFTASSSRDVVKASRELIELLKIREFNEMMQQIAKSLGGMRGSRKGSDQAKGRGMGESGDTGTVSRGRGDKNSSDRDGAEHSDTPSRSKDELGDGEGKGSGDDAEEDADRSFVSSGYTDASDTMKKREHQTRPGPYEELLKSVRPFLNRLESIFRFEKPKASTDFDRSGARLDIRKAMRQSMEPFKIPVPPRKRGQMQISLIIDESGSMSGQKEWEAKRVAMLFFEALRGKHKVRICLAPNGSILAENHDGELGKAYIGGYDSATGTSFNEVLGRELEILNRDRQSVVKYAILIADGESGDHDGQKCRELVQRYKRRGVRCLGVGLCLSEAGDEFYHNIFGDQYISITDAAQLTDYMARIIRTLANRAQTRTH